MKLILVLSAFLLVGLAAGESSDEQPNEDYVDNGQAANGLPEDYRLLGEDDSNMKALPRRLRIVHPNGKNLNSEFKSLLRLWFRNFVEAEVRALPYEPLGHFDALRHLPPYPMTFGDEVIDNEIQADEGIFITDDWEDDSEQRSKIRADSRDAMKNSKFLGFDFLRERDIK